MMVAFLLYSRQHDKQNFVYIGKLPSFQLALVHEVLFEQAFIYQSHLISMELSYSMVGNMISKASIHISWLRCLTQVGQYTFL